MKETETWEQLVPLPMEGVDISPKQEEGMLKVIERGHSCNKALELDSNDEKGLFCRGEDHLVVNDFELAWADFWKVLQLYPNNEATKAQLAVCQQQICRQLAWEKKLYANMFERLAEEENKVKPEASSGDNPTDTEMKKEQKSNTTESQSQVETEA
ncbi:hypothetical protein H8958_000337 [Nasalis larvatus]